MGWVSGLIGQRTFRFWAIAAALVMSMAALAGGIAYGNTASCTNTAATLTDSAFEVDTNANLIVNNPGCVDWLSGGTGTGFRTGVTVKTDTASGSGDESFGNGTKEDTAVPSIVDGGIPPNKSDLKAFGVFTEQGQVSTANPTGKYLALFWTRVQDPSGTTNMDFELNQSTTKSANGVTPVRTNGDLLITYDLSNGGSVATISKRTWNNGSWGPAQAVNPAKGSINTSLIPANQAATLGSLDPRTFGEAVIPFNALFGQNTCGQFGSAYLKSRSSDSFTAALKDFVPPAAVSISNCAALTTNASNNTQATAATVGSSISDTATLSGISPTAGGSITFKAFGPNDANCSGTAAFTSAAIPVSGPGNYNSGNFTPTAVGTYRWTASYSGDASNQSASSPCNAANESSFVIKAKPSISTTLSTESVAVGGSVKDSSTLSDASSDAGGTVTYTVYTNDTCSAGARDAGTKTVTNGVVPDSDALTFNTAGDFYWQASYSGDTNNEAAKSLCTSEHLVVGKAKPSISTTLSTESVTVGGSVKDSSTLSGATANAGGTVTYTVYTNDTCSAGARDAGTKTVTNGVVPDSDALTFDTPGDFYWQASYSGDTNNEAAKSLCTSEHLVVGKAPSKLDTTQSFYPNDAANLSADAGGTPTGSVDFSLFDNSSCSGTPLLSATNRPLDGSGVASTNNTTLAVSTSDTYYWKVEYAGDDNHKPVSSCTENTAMTIDNGGTVISQ